MADAVNRGELVNPPAQTFIGLIKQKTLLHHAR